MLNRNLRLNANESSLGSNLKYRNPLTIANHEFNGSLFQNQSLINQENENNEENGSVNDTIDIEEILQQIIGLKDDNFEQISQTFPSLRRIMNSAEKLTNVGHSEIQLTQFPKSFPSTSTGHPD